MTADDRLAGVVRERSKLGRAMRQVELAAAAASGKDSWTDDLLESLHQLQHAWSDHIATAEAPMGLHDRIVEQAPRLQRAVEQIQLDHHDLAKSIAAAIGAGEDAGVAANKEALRDMAMTLLLHVARHRQHGADLIYDAYSVDIGGY